MTLSINSTIGELLADDVPAVFAKTEMRDMRAPSVEWFMELQDQVGEIYACHYEDYTDKDSLRSFGRRKRLIRRLSPSD